MFDDGLSTEAACIVPSESGGVFVAEVGTLSQPRRRLGKFILLATESRALEHLKAGEKDAIYSLASQKFGEFDGRYEMSSDISKAYIFNHWSGNGKPDDLEPLLYDTFYEYTPHIDPQRL